MGGYHEQGLGYYSCRLDSTFPRLVSSQRGVGRRFGERRVEAAQLRRRSRAKRSDRPSGTTKLQDHRAIIVVSESFLG
jgi:hypothetical protein